jgi:hypothetical protein
MSAAPAAKPGLFGITKSNRDFADPYYWGKNQFNSSFPVALACYMGAKQQPFVYLKYHDTHSTKLGQLSLSDLFGSDKPTSRLYFGFESRFEPFRQFVHDEVPAIDLVVSDSEANKPLTALEIKLTTLPDQTTEALSDDKYGTELVVRSATTRYMALSIAQSLARKRNSIVKATFEPLLAKQRDWGSEQAMLAIASECLDCLGQVLDHHHCWHSIAWTCLCGATSRWLTCFLRRRDQPRPVPK